MVRMSQDEFEANFQLVECRHCGMDFNIGVQNYYSNECPSCHESEN